MADERPTTDATLVGLARQGDSWAFSVLYRRHYSAVFDFLTRLLRDREEAADVAQDTFVKAMQELASLRRPDRFKSWVFTVAYRLGLNRIRSNRRKVAIAGQIVTIDETDDAMALADADRCGDPVQVAEAREVAGMVWGAAASLDARTFVVMDLHVRQGLGSSEIAEVLGVSKATAYTMVSRMKRMFSSALATYLLVQQGRRRCERLATIVPPAAGELTADLRRRADRHSARCDECDRNRQLLLEPVKLFASVVVLPVSAQLARAIADGTGAGGGAGVAPPLEVAASFAASVVASVIAVFAGEGLAGVVVACAVTVAWCVLTLVRGAVLGLPVKVHARPASVLPDRRRSPAVHVTAGRQPLREESGDRDLLDLDGEIGVLFGERTFGMGAEGQGHLVPTDVDVGVVVGHLGGEGDLNHKPDRSAETVELEGAAQFFAGDVPTRVRFQEGGAHGVVESRHDGHPTRSARHDTRRCAQRPTSRVTRSRCGTVAIP